MCAIDTTAQALYRAAPDPARELLEGMSQGTAAPQLGGPGEMHQRLAA
jgi:hypothetical protein